MPSSSGNARARELPPHNDAQIDAFVGYVASSQSWYTGR
jgi:hypothetical protein